MFDDHSYTTMPAAVIDFRRARRKAALQELVARLTGQSSNLLSYEEVRQKLGTGTERDRGLQDIPLDAIVGSVGRYTDFTRTFLPRHDESVHRWARIKMAAFGLGGLPPIEVYKIGDVYFVKDGNHRVSVAREVEATYIQAYVTEVKTEVPLTPDVQPDDLILKAEYADFLKWSDLRRVLPDVDLILTAPGKYEDLKEHIRVHRYYMGLDEQRPVSRSEALAHWYQTVYRPIVDAIHRLGILRDFPVRTETDLYLWISEHRAALEQALEWPVEPGEAAEDLALEYSHKPGRVLARVSDRVLQMLVPDSLGLSTPATGEWREKRQIRYGDDHAHLFRHIMVALDGTESGWLALEEALKLAQHEQGWIFGLHIVRSKDERETEAAQSLRATFEQRCQAAAVPGELAFSTGSIAHEVTQRARWVDLVVAPLNYPPGTAPIAKLRSGFRTLIIQSPCPVLAIPAPLFPISTAVLAYDGSPKSQEALFLATYLAGSQPELSLIVITANPNADARTATLHAAEDYLQKRGVEANYVGVESKDAAEAIVQTAQAHDSRLILMGGYGYNPVLEVVLGSTVNDVLRISRRPVLICH